MQAKAKQIFKQYVDVDSPNEVIHHPVLKYSIIDKWVRQKSSYFKIYVHVTQVIMWAISDKQVHSNTLKVHVWIQSVPWWE